jgi:hypothetical protein
MIDHALPRRSRRLRRSVRPLGCAALLLICASIPNPSLAAAPAPRVRIEYRKPQNPAHEPLYVEARERRLLEQFAEVFSILRLPRTLTLAVAGCDGTSNAWYEPTDTTITFCYEYLADIKQLASSKPHPNVPLQDVRDGPVVFVMLHESGHAVFDLLKVPIFGREEDAADSFAAVTLLRLGKDIALRMLRGAAWAYGQEATARAPDESDFSDVHGLDSQRYFNILCLAYGADPATFAAAMEHGRLPKERAEGCADEYRQAAYAMKKLVAPSLDAAAVRSVRAKHGKRWESGAAPAGGQSSRP